VLTGFVGGDAGVPTPLPAEALSADDFRRATEEVLRTQAATGEGVILGRGAVVLLREHPTALRVRLDGPPDRRAVQATAIQHLEPARGLPPPVLQRDGEPLGQGRPDDAAAGAVRGRERDQPRHEMIIPRSAACEKPGSATAPGMQRAGAGGPLDAEHRRVGGAQQPIGVVGNDREHGTPDADAQVEQTLADLHREQVSARPHLQRGSGGDPGHDVVEVVGRDQIRRGGAHAVQART